MPSPSALIVFGGAGGVFLERVTSTGESCGDTWHLDLDEAIDQARYEYGDAIVGWREIPSEVADPFEYASSLASRKGATLV